MWEVRPARPDDADAIGRVHVDSWRGAYRGVVPDSVLDGLDPVRRAELWRRIMAQPDQTVLIAEDGDGLVGFVSAGPPRDADLFGTDLVELYAIYADPRAWGRGAGAALMRALLSEVPPAAAIILWVLTDNPRARDFYAHFGFEPDGAVRRESFGGQQLEELRYRRPRTPSPGDADGETRHSA